MAWCSLPDPRTVPPERRLRMKKLGLALLLLGTLLVGTVVSASAAGFSNNAPNKQEVDARR